MFGVNEDIAPEVEEEPVAVGVSDLINELLQAAEGVAAETPGCTEYGVRLGSGR